MELPSTAPVLGTVIIYARDVSRTAEFYCKHFGFSIADSSADGLIELGGLHGGAAILVHKAAKSVKLGHPGIKLSFHVEIVSCGVKSLGPKPTASFA